MHEEHQYLELLSELLSSPSRDDRTGVGTRSVFGRSVQFDLRRGFPLLTTKRVPFKHVAVELLWMLSGDTNVKSLHEHDVHIWDEWADADGNLGPVYGKQWRKWLGLHRWVDQIEDLQNGLRDTPYSRRHVITTWNPGHLDAMRLPPCHGIATQFYVEADGALSCSMYQRSADVFLGLPFNIASYSLLTCMLARVLSRPRGRFVWFGGDVHLYRNHEEQASLQLTRAPQEFPQLGFTRDSYENLDDFNLNDFQVVGYQSHAAIKAPVAV